VIPRDAIPCANSIFNSAVVPFENGFVGVFRVDNRCRNMRLHTGHSQDGIHFELNPDPIEFICDDPEVGEFIEGYDPRVCWLEDRYYVSWCNNYHGYTIGLGYTFLFLLWGRPFIVQALAAALILAGTWIAYETYPNAGIDPATGAPEVGVDKQWADEHLQGIRDPWHKNANIGHAVDRLLLNMFPRPEPFQFNKGGYQTINFIPSIVTMLFGLMCGELLRSGRSERQKLALLFAAGILGLVAGQLLQLNGLCPLIKRIWTPSWVLHSTGLCCLILASLYVVIDIAGIRRWSFPLVVVGMNSIAVYCMSMSLKPWTARQLQTHLGNDVFALYGSIPPAYTPMVQATMVGLMFWLVCYYMYRNEIFIRI
jgi:predicted acyltransferase